MRQKYVITHIDKSRTRVTRHIKKIQELNWSHFGGIIFEEEALVMYKKEKYIKQDISLSTDDDNKERVRSKMISVVF